MVSEIEVLIILFLRDVLKTQFVKMLSISVALDVVTLVGLLFRGIAPFLNMLTSQNFDEIPNSLG